jgi:hypothetical protein
MYLVLPNTFLIIIINIHKYIYFYHYYFYYFINTKYTNFIFYGIDIVCLLCQNRYHFCYWKDESKCCYIVRRFHNLYAYIDRGFNNVYAYVITSHRSSCTYSQSHWLSNVYLPFFNYLILYNYVYQNILLNFSLN